MILSDFINENIIQDGEFFDLGYSNHFGNKLLTFCDNLYYLDDALNNENVSCIIVKENMLEKMKNLSHGIIVSDSPRKLFFELYNKLRDQHKFHYNLNYGLGSNVSIAQSAIISEKSFIGSNSIISENVVIKENVFIGKNCFIDAGVIIGNEGILYSYDEHGNKLFIRHAGSVVIEDNSTVLANAVIVKSVFPNMPTTVGQHSIIGIATTIGHEAQISQNCSILGNCVIAKNAKIGQNSTVGSSSVVRENIVIGENASVKAGSIVVKNVKDGEEVSGNFAYNHLKHVKNFAREQRNG